MNAMHEIERQSQERQADMRRVVELNQLALNRVSDLSQKSSNYLLAYIAALLEQQNMSQLETITSEIKSLRRDILSLTKRLDEAIPIRGTVTVRTDSESGPLDVRITGDSSHRFR